MRPNRLLPLLLLLAGWNLMCPQRSVAQGVARSSQQIDCSSVLATMKKDFAAEPARLVLAMEDALTTEERCVCPIIRTAIDLAGHDPALTSRLVLSAIRMVPAAAARITECALAEAPETASAIKAALANELGEKSVPWLALDSSKPEESPGKAPPDGKSPVGQAPGPVLPVPPDEAGETEDFTETLPAVGVSGIYVIARPQTASRSPSSHGVPVREVSTVRQPRPRRPVESITRDSPG